MPLTLAERGAIIQAELDNARLNRRRLEAGLPIVPLDPDYKGQAIQLARLEAECDELREQRLATKGASENDR